MSTRLKHEMRYEGATIEQVHDMLALTEFREAVCAYQRYPERTVDINVAGEAMTVRVDQFRPADEVPSFAKKFVGDKINVLQEETWHSHSSGDLLVTIPGKPGEMRGTITMAEVGGGVTETVDVQVKVSIPLIGGKLEDFIGGMLLRALKAENKVGITWLAEH